MTVIGQAMFANCPALVSVTIPDSVERIDAGAFEDCWSLKEVTIPENTELNDHYLAYKPINDEVYDTGLIRPPFPKRTTVIRRSASATAPTPPPTSEDETPPLSGEESPPPAQGSTPREDLFPLALIASGVLMFLVLSAGGVMWWRRRQW